MFFNTLFTISSCIIALASTAPPARADAAATPTRTHLTAKANGDDVTFTYRLRTTFTAPVVIQIYAHRDDVSSTDRWDAINPKSPEGAPLVIDVTKDVVNSGQFEMTLPDGRYGKFRILLFGLKSGAPDFGSILYDSNNDPGIAKLSLNLAVPSTTGNGQRSSAPIPTAAPTHPAKPTHPAPNTHPAATRPAGPPAKPSTTVSANDANPDSIGVTYASITAVADLGEATFTYHFTTARSANGIIQIYAHRDDITGADQWDSIVPAGVGDNPLSLSLYKGIDNSGTFNAPLPQGKYGKFRILLFGSSNGNIDFSKVYYDSNLDPAKPDLNLNLTIASDRVRLKKPAIVPGLPKVGPLVDGSYTVTLPATLEIPKDYKGTEKGFWVMGKGTGGFCKQFVSTSMAQPSANPSDTFTTVPVTLTFKDVKAGLWNVALGLFGPDFGDPIEWLNSGADFEAGGDSWEQKAPEGNIPPLVRVKNRRFVTLNGAAYKLTAAAAGDRAVSFVRGGNYGNAILWTIDPQPSSAGYFELLHEMGCSFMRINFDADRYSDQPVYQHAVDQLVQNIWAAGMFPLICPQDLPKAPTMTERIAKGLRVVQAMANNYNERSVWLEICNEPREFGTWAAWKPVAEEYVKAIRAIDPDALVVVPFEGWSKDGRGAAADPITDVDVDLYDGHAYVKPDQVATLFGGPAATLPELIGEYGGGDAEYLHQLDLAFQQMSRPPVAIAPWAFTVKGQDSIPLIADGSTAQLQYTSRGRAIAADFAAWDSGTKIGPLPATPSGTAPE